MPPTTQRRKRAYLNGANYCSRRVGLDLDGQETATQPGLAIDLRGSVDRPFRPVSLAARGGSLQLTLERRGSEGKYSYDEVEDLPERFVRSNG